MFVWSCARFGPRSLALLFGCGVGRSLDRSLARLVIFVFVFVNLFLCLFVCPLALGLASPGRPCLGFVCWVSFGLFGTLVLFFGLVAAVGLLWQVSFFVWICSTSPPGGNQVDGLPPVLT